MPELTFRPLEQDDRQGIVDFFARLGEPGSTFFNRDRGNERGTMRFFEQEVPNTRFFVTCLPDDPTPAGLCFLWDLDTMIPWMGIGVRHDCLGQHIGSFTIDHLLAFAGERGCGGVLLTTAQDNFPAQRLYESRGFEKLGVHHDGEFLYLKRFAAGPIAPRED
ncbi:MAG: GNAT family N-acetyltransferase [Oscillospiraceae bacterium]|nr:GNAT family N-acetyltransferase [Oscillospiraceae bacterium]